MLAVSFYSCSMGPFQGRGVPFFTSSGEHRNVRKKRQADILNFSMCAARQNTELK